MKKRNLSEENLDKLLTNLYESTHSPYGEFSAEESYKKLAERIPSRKVKRFHIFRYAAAVAALFIIGISTYLFTGIGTTEMITFSTTDETKEITLPDGTKVTLSHYSSLIYPADFKGDTREVTLSGEAYFEVYKDKRHPFILQTQEVQVKVLGTHFNVQSYANDPFIKTTLLEGSVLVSNTKNDNTIILKPHESAVFCKGSAQLFQEPNIHAEDDIAWLSGRFVFNNLALSDITRDLSNYFNIKIEIANDALKEYKLTARFENEEDIDEILTLLQTAGNFTWSKSANSIIIKPKLTK